MIDLNALAAKISPSPAEERKIKDIADDLLSQTKKLCKEAELNAEPMLVGSVSKGTFLDPDIDVFIAFDRKYERSVMVKNALKIGHKILKNGEERYAEHPYVTGSVSGIKVDIVPCYNITEGEKIISAVDRSPLHTRFMLKNLNDNERKEVRLLKAFMKASGIYGSEIRTKGFSGYVCEILILKLGSFDACVKSFASTRGKYLLPVGDDQTRKFREPVVIIDPVDLNRNAGAAISLENLSKMRVISKEFLAAPSEEYFFKKTEKKPRKMYRGTEIRIFRIPSPDGTDDTIYPQAERFRKILSSILAEGGFSTVGSELDVGKNIDVLVECRFKKSPEFLVHRGPPADSERTHEFMTKWESREDVIGPYIEEDRLLVDVPNDPVEIEKYVKSRLESYNIGAQIDSLKDEMIIIDPMKGKQEYHVLEKYFSRSVI